MLLEGLLQHYDPPIDETNFDAKPDKKLYNKFYFRRLLQRYKIINKRHYQEVLSSSEELQECEIYMNPSPLEGYKKLVFMHNFKEMKKSFERLFVVSYRNRNRIGIVCCFLKTIALEVK